MSSFDPRRLPGAPGSVTAWRWFPLATVVSFVLVFAVNGWLAWEALSTFPGLAVADDFDSSNHYDRVLEAAAAQAGLGWALEARIEAARPVVVLTGADGAPLRGALVTATLRRPLGPPQTAYPAFLEEAGGVYRADADLATPGQWELLLRVNANGHELTATRRVILR